MTHRNLFPISAVVTALIILTSCSSGTPEQRESRRLNAQGNELYEADRFAEAEAAYTKAVSADPSNIEAKYNLALSMIRQAGPGESGKKLLAEAQKLLTEVWQNPDAPARVASDAAYNIGNIAYNSQQWDPAIAAYKQSLRFDDDFNDARENLRLAQLKKDNQDQNQNQDQNKDQNKDQQDQEKKDNDNKQQDQPQDNKNDNNDKQQPQQPKPQNGISDENAEKILKAMENEEAATRRRVQDAEKRKAASAGRRVVNNPW